MSASVPELHLETLNTLRAWAGATQRLLVSTSQLMGAVWNSPEIGERETDTTLAVIYNACFSTSDSALGLAAAGKTWDADILIRSVYEGTTKFVFICHPDAAERLRRVREYRIELPDVASMRDHSRLETLLPMLPDPDAPEWRPLREMLLSAEGVEELRSEYPRARRRELEQRWSFSEITGWLSKSGIGDFAGFTGLLHGYGMSSHLAHVDWTGAHMVWERGRRSTQRMNAIEMAHGGRIMADTLTAAALRVAAAYRYKGFSLEPVRKASLEQSSLRDRFAAADNEWRTIEYPDTSADDEA